MTELSNNRKTISITTSDTIVNRYNAYSKTYHYEIKLPAIICSDRDDAKFIQKQINILANELVDKCMKE